MSASPAFAEAATTQTFPLTPPVPVASLTHVTKRYANGVLALDDLSISLHRGEIVVLLGPNGAGKSTAIKLMMGLSTPISGAVRVFGSDPRDSAARLRTGVMLQVDRAPKMLRVREHINLFRDYYPSPLPYADIVCATGLEGIGSRFFGQLSGGQRQRVLFALALAGDPDLVILDEPTVGLDIESRRLMWSQIRSLAARGKTVLLTTHYLQEADALAHRVIVINNGRVVCEGTPAEVKSLSIPSTDATTNCVLKIIRCSTTLSETTLRTLSGVTAVDIATTVATITSTRPEVTLRELLALDHDLQSLEVQSPALEDAFLALTAD